MVEILNPSENSRKMIQKYKIENDVLQSAENTTEADQLKNGLVFLKKRKYHLKMD